MLSGGKTELQVTSDLLGTTIKLPQPYKKTANQSRSLKVRLEAGTPNILRANYDQNVRAEFALTGDQTPRGQIVLGGGYAQLDRKSTRLNSSHVRISYAVFCLKKKKNTNN